MEYFQSEKYEKGFEVRRLLSLNFHTKYHQISLMMMRMKWEYTAKEKNNRNVEITEAYDGIDEGGASRLRGGLWYRSWSGLESRNEF